jgi:hypothetical protein
MLDKDILLPWGIYYMEFSIQRVSEISTLILTSDSSRTTKFLCMIFSKYNFRFSTFHPHKLASCLFTRIF